MKPARTRGGVSQNRGRPNDERSSGDILLKLAELQALARREEQRVIPDQEAYQLRDKISAAHLRRILVREELAALEQEALNRLDAEVSTLARETRRQRLGLEQRRRVAGLILSAVAIGFVLAIGLALSGIVEVDPTGYWSFAPIIRVCQEAILALAKLMR
jgi:hypothetical protein